MDNIITDLRLANLTVKELATIKEQLALKTKVTKRFIAKGFKPGDSVQIKEPSVGTVTSFTTYGTVVKVTGLSALVSVTDVIAEYEDGSTSSDQPHPNQRMFVQCHKMIKV